MHTGAGVIDADYRGPVKVLLFNLSGDEFKVGEGDRVAQLIVERVRISLSSLVSFVAYH
jgi:dUTP pyrophosphatase